MLIRLSLFCLLSVTAWAQCKVVETDLTKGAPQDKRFTVSGGAWKNGWNVTGDLDRIQIDAGYEIRNGYLEVVVARKDGVTFAEGQRKRNWLGLFACDTMNQCPGGYARAGGEGYAFSKAEIFSSKQPNTICEKKFGEYADWVMDDKTEHTVRAEIRNGVMTWTSKVGAKTGQTACGDATQPVTHFRYATVGGILTEKKGWHHGSLVGLRVLRATIVDYDRAQSCPALKAAAQPRGGVVVFEDPLNGATKGEQQGGEFVAGGGWRALKPYDRLLIQLPQAARDGSAFEIDIKNLDVPKQRDAGENFLFGLWEQLDGEAGGDQNQPARDCFYLYAGTKYPQFKAKLHTHGFGWNEENAAPIASFDPNRTYRFRIEWKDGMVTAAVDGKVFLTWESPALDPMDRIRVIQIAARHGTKSPQQGLRGPIYSNVRVVMPAPADPTAPFDLVVAEQSFAATRLEWQAPQETKAIKHYQVYRDGQPVQTTTGTNYTDNRLPDGEYHYTVKAVSAAGTESPASNAVKVNVVASSLAAKRAAAVKVDGKLDEAEWDVSRRAFKQLKGSSTESVKFGALWDDEYLYVGVRVADTKLVKDSAKLTDDDAIEILIDGNNNGAPLAYNQRAFDSFDRQFIKRWNDDGLYVKRGGEKGAHIADGKVDGLRHAVARVEGGYAVELAIAWGALGLTPGDVKSLGFDVRRYDDDDGQEVDAITVWQSEHLSPVITSAYGDLTLAPAGGNAEQSSTNSTADRATAAVIDADLTKGRPADHRLTVRGGEWNDGWRVTGNDQRLVWDAGYPIKNGYFEFWLTADAPPASPLTEFRGKIHHPDVHWAGVSGIADLALMKRHVFALRLGQTTEGISKGHGWSKLVVLGANNDGETEKTEQVMGDYAWWKPLSDGKQVIHFKMEWRDGIASLSLPDGNKQSCRTTGKMGNEVLISGLRYAWLGGIDEELKTAIPGMRFLRARLVDLDKAAAHPATRGNQR